MESKYRKCHEPHLRDYPDCFEECGCDTCKAPLFSENQESSPPELELTEEEIMTDFVRIYCMECYQCGCLEHCNAYRAELIRRKSTAKDALAKAMPVINAQKAEIEKLRAELETAVEKETFAIQEADNLRTEIEKWKYLQQHAVDVGVEQLEEIEKLKEEKGLLDAMFEMTWKADVEAIKMWREQHPDQELVIPDERKLIIWLIDQIASLKAKVRELEDDDGVKTKGFDY